MLVSKKWLQTYVHTEASPAELSEKLVLAGIENNLIYKDPGEISQVVVGKILRIEPHPEADKLVICYVDVQSEVLPIVTGATNVRAGDLVPVALPGAVLPGGVLIEAITFRGVESKGMLCAPDELGVGLKDLPHDQREGILILQGNAAPGEDIKAVLDLDDIVFELELTTNRSDCLSIIGSAREVAALTAGTISLPQIVVPEAGEPVETLAGLEIRDVDLCPRCIVRVIQDIKIAPSPYWMQQRLRSAGIRPINNLVDVTNYVMMEMGQPLHAYDYDTLVGHKIIVRRVVSGEAITTLDGSELELEPGMLVIADDQGPVGLAGVMGGLATEITPATRTVLLEAACFNGISIRRTYKKFGLRSEAAVRFEKGVDPNNTEDAINRAAQLLAEMGAGKVARGILDIYPVPVTPAEITLRVARINWLLGTSLNLTDVTEILDRLQFAYQVLPGGEKLVVTVPTRRGIIKSESDLVEEIARIYGFNNVPDTLPQGHTAQGVIKYELQVEKKVRDILTGGGMMEAMTFSFINPNAVDRLRLAADSPLRQLIPVKNPITEDQAVMRTTLMSSLLEVVGYNLSRQVMNLQLFEIANVFLPKALPLVELPEERSTLTCAVTGRNIDPAWNREPESLDFYSLKGQLDRVFAGLGLSESTYLPTRHSSFHPGRTAVICLGGVQVGVIGELHPKVLAEYGIAQRVVMAELDLTAVTAKASLVPRYQPLPRYPAITRDMAILVPVTVAAGELLEQIRATGGALLEEVSLFDVYTGGKIPEGYKSMAYSLVYRAEDRTLTDLEVEETHSHILAGLADRAGAKLR